MIGCSSAVRVDTAAVQARRERLSSVTRSVHILVLQYQSERLQRSSGQSEMACISSLHVCALSAGL
jgi:hypothetical protein